MKRRMPWAEVPERKTEEILDREWLVTNGLGGYASGTVPGVPTRRYHGWLVAAHAAPLGRVMMLDHLSESIALPDGRRLRFGGEERRRSEIETHGLEYLQEFRLDKGLPVWRARFDAWVIERSIILPHKQNTAYIMYRLIEGEEPVRLRVRPSVHFRGHDVMLGEPLGAQYVVTCAEHRCEIHGPQSLPPLRMRTESPNGLLTLDGGSTREIFYRAEADRGYGSVGVLWSPGYFTIELHRDRPSCVVASTEEWPTMLALSGEQALALEHERRDQMIAAAHPHAREGLPAELVLAADQFIIAPVGRSEDAARARAAGDEMRTVIAGYHWFTDWGRDTMISLEGLTLSTGRHTEARWILKMFANAVQDGLIPNLFPEGQQKGLYHTADASLWFFHAVERYLAATRDRGTLRYVLPKLVEIAEAHLQGTRFGIGVDPKDGLLRQGEQGYQLTWMDAKVDDWVVTPRRGKAVEINALWFNALTLLSRWLAEEGDKERSEVYATHAERARVSFNQRFWNPQRNCLFDVVDGERGDDPALRPNQVFAISLDNPVLARERWAQVVQLARETLVTPVGLRSLAPGEADYKAQYFGDLRARDAAYHQGTVWAFLVGHFVDAWLKVHPEDRTGARELLSGFDKHMHEGCIGSISEVFDAQAPFTQRGCIAQAWSVAEVLRAWIRTA
ncbi:MAG: amylo-alpha-1,6-glucosidase [Myxococcota bacterium]